MKIRHSNFSYGSKSFVALNAKHIHGGNFGRKPVGSALKPFRICAVGKENERSERAAAPVQWLVGLATEGLRILRIGNSSNKDSVSEQDRVPPGTTEPLQKGDVEGVLKILREDFEQRAYFVTGILSDTIYDEECRFVDPTISFRGRELWKRNLQLLTPFLDDPSIDLLSLDRMDPSQSNRDSEDIVLRAEWILKCGLRLPWKPYVVVRGATAYVLDNEDNNRIVDHVETWNISGLQALLLIITPGQKQKSKSK